MTGTHTRVKCPLCDRDIALLKSGVFRVHGDAKHEMFGTGQPHLVPPCEATGIAPDKAERIARSRSEARARRSSS